MICLLRQWGNSFDQKQLHLDGHMSTYLCSCVDVVTFTIIVLPFVTVFG